MCSDSNLIQQIKPNSNDIKLSHQTGFILSPNYPTNYSKQSECFILIKAPRNYLIKLSFEIFNLEPSVDCTYDYLEIRDGPYGYSPLIGKYCGHKHPYDILSSSNELWIKFSSDDSIEQTGFKIYYEFKKILSSMYINDKYIKYKTKVLECEIFQTYEEQTKTGDVIMTQEFIEKKFNKKLNDFRTQFDDDQVDAINSEQIDCTVFIEVDKKERIFLNFVNVNINSSIEPSSSQTCTQNFVQLYDGSTSTADKKFQFCTNVANKIYKSKTNRIYLRYNLNRSQAHDFVFFKLIFNPYKNGPCDITQFDCLDSTCINRTLACNGRQNCNHSVDEIGCSDEFTEDQDKKRWNSEERLAVIHTIIISIVGVILIIAVAASIIVSCKRSLKSSRFRREEFESVKLMKNMSILSKLNRDTLSETSTIDNPKLVIFNPYDNRLFPVVSSIEKVNLPSDDSSLNLSDIEYNTTKTFSI